MSFAIFVFPLDINLAYANVLVLCRNRNDIRISGDLGIAVVTINLYTILIYGIVSVISYVVVRFLFPSVARGTAHTGIFLMVRIFHLRRSTTGAGEQHKRQ